MNLPITERIHKEVLSLPIGPAIHRNEMTVIIRAIKDFFENVK